MIYLASPYTHKDPKIMEQRFLLVVKECARYMKQERLVYSPIVHNHPIATRHQLPRDWNFWKIFDIGMLRLATEFHIFCIDGWKESSGVLAEKRIAETLLIPIRYTNPL